ncbi:alpha/beta fold hydrolase [Peribacillus glennii]|uniref:Alpha/beta fold hydrolase n=1 Tax=Peribacillus glennii TaxID=2303991 RepID=A0A372LGU5_9BACI|nr:alpha/beta fold hydrolase [Peribacillus glennii]RFU65299.1 alpha/beta fold hydrolase [Peribacillus glennii]
MKKRKKDNEEGSSVSKLQLAFEALKNPLPKMGVTRREPVWKKNKAILWYYPPEEKKYGVPVFFVYSLINQPVILDLGPGSSLIEHFVNEGFEVYLLDFGPPGYEDGDISLETYIVNYIQTGVRRALRHSGAKEITIFGVCLGGTLAAMYASMAEEPIKNLILSTPPIDFSHSPEMDQWAEALRKGDASFDEILDVIQTVPGFLVNRGLSLLLSPIHFSSYLSLLTKADDREYVAKWRRFNKWTNGHVPFAGAAVKQMLNDLVRDNKFLKGHLLIKNKKALLTNIKANLLVVAGKDDALIPETMVKPVMELVSSQDKMYRLLKGGHTTINITPHFPDYLAEWLPERSAPIGN